MREGSSTEIEFKDTPAEGLQALIDSCYSAKLRLTEENVADVLAAAHLLLFTKVVEKCAEFFLKRLKPHNCLGIHTLANQFNLAALSEAASELIAQDYLEVSKSDEFHHLASGQLIEVLARDDLKVASENDVVMSAISWVEIDKASRAKFLPHLLKHIRFLHLKPEVRFSRIIFTRKVG